MRRLSSEFMADLRKQDGILNPVLERARTDATLDLQIREDAVNVCYRGGSLVAVERKKGSYRFSFNPGYFGEQRQARKLPPTQVSTKEECNLWIAAFPTLKEAMDTYKEGRGLPEEKEIQQSIVRYNNYSSVAGGTDYFILDTEYKVKRGARFDLIGIRWESDAPRRKLQRAYHPRLVLMEIKNGAGAVAKKCGIAAHLRDLRKLLSSADSCRALKEEMVGLLAQKRDLGLIPGLKGKANEVAEFDETITSMLLLANYDAESEGVRKEWEEVESDAELRKFVSEVCWAQAHQIGYGLYEEGVMSLREGMASLLRRKPR